MMSKIFSISLFIYLMTGPGFKLVAQETLQTLAGQVKNTKGEPIIGATILVSDSLSTTLCFGISQNQGNYNIELPNIPNLFINISVRSLGYKSLTEQLTIDPRQERLQKDFILQASIHEFEEITISGLKPIKETNDTILFRANDFRDDTEEVAEDLLKKLPGVSVTESGKISYQGKEIKKILLDGDDLTDSNYKILSKNLPATLIEEIEILQNHNDSRLLKGIEKSGEIAINLKIEEGKQAPLFGDIHVGAGLANVYHLESNLLSYNKLFKGVLFLDANNIGNDAVGSDYQRFTSSRLSYDQVPELEKLYDKQIQYPSFLSKQYFRRNNSKYGSFSWINKPNDKLTINGIHSILDDRKTFNQFENTNYTIDPSAAPLTQSQSLYEQMSPNEYFSDIRVEKKLSKRSDLRLSYNLVQQQNDYQSTFSLNSNTGSEQASLLEHQHLLEASNLTKLSKNMAMENQFSLIDGGLKEKFNFDELSRNQEIKQNNKQTNQSIAWVNTIKWAPGNSYFNIRSGWVHSAMSLTTQVRSTDGQQELSLMDFNTAAKLQSTSLFSEILAEHKLNSQLSLVFGGRVRKEHRRLYQNKAHLLFFEPSMRLNYKREKSSVSFLFNQENILPGLSDLISEPILNSFDAQSLNQFQLSDSWKNDTWIFTYKFADNYKKYISAFFQMMYVEQAPALFSSLNLEETGILRVRNSLNNNLRQPRWSAKIGFDKFLPKWASTFKVRYQWSQSENFFQLNEQEQVSRLSGHSVDLSFAQKITPKVHFGGSFAFSRDRFKANDREAIFTNHFNWTSRISYQVAKKTKATFKTRHMYFSRSSSETSTSSHIGSFQLSHQLKPNKIKLGLNVENLFNQKNIGIQSNSGFALLDQTYELIPRYILASVQYRL